MDEDEDEDEKAERLKTIEILNAGVEERLAAYEKVGPEAEAWVRRVLESYRTNRLRAEAQRPKS